MGEQMSLKELAEQYRETSAKCKAGLRVLKERVNDESIGETERLILRRKCTILEGMARETAAIAKYLGNYYGSDGV